MPRSAAIIHAFEAGTELTGAAVQKGPRGNVAYEGINAPGLAPASLFEAQLISRFGSLPPDVAPPAAGKPAQGSGDGVVITTLPSLDPPCGTQVFISAELDGSTDGFEVAIFSRANALCAAQKVSGRFGKGWHRESITMKFSPPMQAPNPGPPRSENS